MIPDLIKNSVSTKLNLTVSAMNTSPVIGNTSPVIGHEVRKETATGSLGSTRWIWLTLCLVFMVAGEGASSKSVVVMKINDARHVEFGGILIPASPSAISSTNTRYCYFDNSKKCPQSNEGSCYIDSRPCHSNRSYLNNIYKKQPNKFDKVFPSYGPSNPKPTNSKKQVNGVDEIIQGYNIYNFNNEKNSDINSYNENNNKQLKKRVEAYQDYSSIYNNDDGSRPPWLPGTRPFHLVMQLIYFIHNSLKITFFAIINYVRNLRNGDTSSNM